jgi:hypothetical protein
MLMQQKIQLMALVAATLVAGTAGAFAQVYDRYGNAVGWQPVGPRPGYETSVPPPMYYPGPVAWGRGFNGTNHPTPSSTQGDVGPGGNNNGTLTGRYRQW